MSYTLRSAVTEGSVDPDHVDGTYRIRDGHLECESYATACALVERVHHLEWPDGDPGPAGEAGADDTDADTETKTDPDGTEAETLADLSYRELQDRAKAAEIPANQSADDLRAALQDEV